MAFEQKEFRLHAAAVRYLRTVCPDCIVFHPANGEKRAPETARKLKAMGVLPGVFDLVLLAPGPRCFFLEAKSEDGELEPDQEIFRDWLILAGFQYGVFRTLDHIRDFIIQNKIPHRLSAHETRLSAA